MKTYKLYPIILAVMLAALSSFSKTNANKQDQVQRSHFYAWFDYAGYGDPGDPSSYSLSAWTPECNSISTYLCAVYAELDWWTWQPTYESLFYLAASSSYFTDPYTGPEGEVRFEDY